MYVLKNICFVCLTDNDKNLKSVFCKETEEIFTKVKYTLPELVILTPKNPLYICSGCHTTLCSFFMFKKRCLENYSRLDDYINVLQRSNDTPDQSFRIINCLPLANHQNDIHLNIEENEDVLQHDQKTEVDDIIEVKEESLACEDSADRDFYQQLVKSESVSDNEQDGGSSITSEDNNSLDKNKTNSNTETDSQEFQCLICNDVFTDRLTYDAHLRNHIVNIIGLECLICNKKWRDKTCLIRHMKTHLGIKDEECLICKKKFILKCNLKAHMKIHTGIKGYECSICKKKFILKCNLNVHMKIHTGIKDYECSICKKKFILNCNLKVHMKIHTGIKDYECSFCKKKFTQSGNLSAHIMKIHKGIK